MNIYLIGMPGSGKSTIGKELAHRLQRKWIDLDQYIEERSFMFIPDIFTRYGEKYFRDLETNCLEEVSKQKNVVVSCGGGIVVQSANKELMTDGLILYLYTDIMTLLARTKDSEEQRPLLKTKSMRDLFGERKEKYTKFADYTFDATEDNLIENILKKVVEIDESIGD